MKFKIFYYPEMDYTGFVFKLFADAEDYAWSLWKRHKGRLGYTILEFPGEEVRLLIKPENCSNCP